MNITPYQSFYNLFERFFSLIYLIIRSESYNSSSFRYMSVIMTLFDFFFNKFDLKNLIKII